MSRVEPSKMQDYLTARQAAQRTDLWIRLGALVLAVVLLISAGLLVGPINEVRRDTQLTLDDDSLRGLPPDIVLMTKGGTARGLAIVMSFIRLEELKQENRFYELMQLSDWLCKLAPTYPTVWQYSAWNMAYNISVCQYSAEARWMWVNNGIENLRNRGIRYNPKNISLYKELSWIFWHKIGDILDDYHWEYKKELAVSMERILGEPPVTINEEDLVAFYKEIADAPKDVSKLIAEDAEVAKFVEELKQANPALGPDATLLDFVARNMRVATDFETLVLEDAMAGGQNPRIAALKVLRNPDNERVAKLLIATLRSQILSEKLNMDIKWMVHLMEEFGPIDWRSPFAHSLYWSTYGDHVSKGIRSINENDSMNAVRFIFFSIENMCGRGQVVLEPNFDKPNQSFLQLLPDSRFIKHLHQAYLKYGEEQFKDDPNFVPGTSGPNYWAGHKNLLNRAIKQLYLEGGEEKIAEAKEYYFYLREYDLTEDGRTKPRYQKTFEQYVLGDVYEALETQKGATTFVSSLLMRSLDDLSRGDISSCVHHVELAVHCWKFYMKGSDTDANTRRRLDSVGVMRRDMAIVFMNSPERSLLQKHRLWKALDSVTRRAIYDEVIEIVTKYCEAHDPPFDPAKTLPIPAGMEEYRENPDEVLEELQRLDPTLMTGEKIYE